MNFTSESSAETISRTPPTQIVQCSMRMPCISNISSFCVRAGYWALSQSKPFGVRIFWISRNSKKVWKCWCHSRMSVPMNARTAFEPLIVDIAEQAALNLVVDGRAEEGRVQVLLAKRHRGRRFVPRAPLGNHAAVWEDLPVRRHVDIGKRRAAGLEEPLLVPLRDVMVVSRDRHRSNSFDTGTIQRTSMRSLASLLECKNSETKTRKKCPDCELPARPSDLSPLGHLRHFERPLEMSAMPPIATKNGEPLKRRRANGNNFSNRFPQIVAALTVLPVRSCLIDGEAVVCNESGLAVFDLIRGYRHDAAAVLCAFDLLELDGEDLRRTPIEERKRILAKLSVTPMKASPSTSTTRATARSSSSTPARSAARASCRSGLARPTAPAAPTVG